jgi:hypothetical protein
VIRRRRCCPRCNFIGWTVEAFESDDIAAAAKARRELRRIAEAVSEATERMSAITGMK